LAKNKLFNLIPEYSASDKVSTSSKVQNKVFDLIPSYFDTQEYKDKLKAQANALPSKYPTLPKTTLDTRSIESMFQRELGVSPGENINQETFKPLTPSEYLPRPLSSPKQNTFEPLSPMEYLSQKTPGKYDEFQKKWDGVMKAIDENPIFKYAQGVGSTVEKTLGISALRKWTGQEDLKNEINLNADKFSETNPYSSIATQVGSYILPVGGGMNILSKIPKLANKPILTGALSAGLFETGKGVLEEKPVKEIATNAATSAAFMTVGGATTRGLEKVGAKILQNSPQFFKNSIAAEITKSIFAGAGGGVVGGTAARQITNPGELPESKEMLYDAVLMGVMHGFNAIPNTIMQSRGVSEQLFADTVKFANTMDKLNSRAIIEPNTNKKIQYYNEMKDGIDKSLSNLYNNRFVGNNKIVTDLQESLMFGRNAIDNKINMLMRRPISNTSYDVTNMSSNMPNSPNTAMLNINTKPTGAFTPKQNAMQNIIKNLPTLIPTQVQKQIKNNQPEIKQPEAQQPEAQQTETIKYKHFTSPEGKIALESGKPFDYALKPIHGTGGLDNGPKEGRISSVPAIYLSLDDSEWGNKVDFIEKGKARPYELSDKGNKNLKSFYDYEEQKWMVIEGEYSNKPLDFVEYRIKPEAKIPIVDSIRKLEDISNYKGKKYYTDSDEFWKMLNERFDGVQFSNVKKYSQESKFFKSVMADQIVIFNKDAIEIQTSNKKEVVNKRDNDKPFDIINKYAEKILNDVIKQMESTDGKNYVPEKVKPEQINNMRSSYRDMYTRLYEHIQNKRFNDLTEILHSGNKHSLNMFQEITGKPMKNYAQIKEGIRSLDPEAYDIWLQKKKEKQEEESKTLKQKAKEERDKKFQDEIKQKEENEANKKINYKNRIITFKEFIQEIFNEGFRFQKTNEYGGFAITDTKKSFIDIKNWSKDARWYAKNELNRLQNEEIQKDEIREQEEYEAMPQEDKDYINNFFNKMPNSGIIKEGGVANGISDNEIGLDVRETSKNLSTEDVQKPTGEEPIDETYIRGAGESENSDSDNGIRGNEPRPSDGVSNTIATDTGGEGSRKQPAINQDYVIATQEDVIVDTSKKSRFNKNIDAIKTLLQIEKENRQATYQEQKILAQYVGWGGLAEAFDKYKSDWKDEHTLLKEILSEKEYESAHDTILNAHYTSIDVIKGMYEGLKHFGFNGGRVLEPSVGIGNFIGSMPQEDRAKTNVFTGIEIDSITGRIATLLYPNSDIRIQGFEKSKLPSNYYDVAISNVPFGKVRVVDTKFPDAITRSIHNYFFAKTLDVVRPGGLIMYITSSHTLDSKDTAGIRNYIKNKADLVGAIRLPNTAFKDNAGTEVTTDIIILKVREPNTEYQGEPFFKMVQTDMEKEYPNMYVDPNSMQINEYFKEHPENILGTLTYGRGAGGYYNVIVKGDERNIKESLSEAFKKMPAKIIDYTKTTKVLDTKTEVQQKAKTSTKNGSYEVVDGKLKINRHGNLQDVDKGLSTKDITRVKELLFLKDSARSLLTAQMNGLSDVAKLQKQLNKLYDDFVAKYGYINDIANHKHIADDPDVSFLLALENYDKKAKKATKADIFTENKIGPIKKVDKVQTSKEALVVSLIEDGLVDIDKMVALVGKSKDEILLDLAGLIYKDPLSGVYVPADEYLSGNVKAKLYEAEARAFNESEFKANVEALKTVIPKDKESWEIRFKIGSSLISPEIYIEFSKHLFGTRSQIEISQNKFTGEWIVREADNAGYNSIKRSKMNTEKWGIDVLNFKGINLLDKIMNGKSIVVVEKVGDQKVINQKLTALAQLKAENISEEFEKWIITHNEGNTIKQVVQDFNDRFNTDKLREVNGSHLPDTFPGMNINIKLAPHQKDAVWRAITSKAPVLLAHEVGAGKTFEMITIVMELKRLGLSKKSLIVVPNNIYEQWGIEFRRLYPGAKILVPTKEDLQQKNRKILMNKIAVGDYDGVIIPESQFTMLPMSIDNVEAFVNKKMAEFDNEIEMLQSERRANEKPTMTEKNLIRMRKNFQAKMETKIEKMKKDADNISFEELGIDSLIVDEAHRFKNLMFTTRQQISGLGNPSGSTKSFDLLMKVNYLHQLNGGKGIVFATATPILNSLSESYNWFQYLAPGMLESRGIYSFDQWLSIYARVEDIAEVNTTGSGYRIKKGVSKVTNVGQLATMFRTFTDFKTQEMLQLKRPDIKDNKYQLIEVPATEWQIKYIQELADRVELLKSGRVDPKDDNALKITSDGRKAALDPRLIDPSFVPLPGEVTKLDMAIEHIYEQWKKTKKDRLTHLVFIEMSTPKSKDEQKEEIEDGEDYSDADKTLDSVYQDLKRKLIAKGVPDSEIAFIHDAKNADQKVKLKNKFNAGEIRILIGNNEKMGVGIDLQVLTKTITHVDFPWRPKDLQQEDGRGLRQGNINKEIELYALITKRSFDARLWNNLERKSQVIDSFLNADINDVEVEDPSAQALSAQEIAAIATDNPLMQEQVVVNKELNKLKTEKKAFEESKSKQLTELPKIKANIEQNKILLQFYKELATKVKSIVGDNFTANINGKTFNKMMDADEYIRTLRDANAKKVMLGEIVRIPANIAGIIDGIEVRYQPVTQTAYVLFMVGKKSFMDAQNMSGLSHNIKVLPDHISRLEQYIKTLINDEKIMIEESQKTFTKSERLKELLIRASEISRILNPEQVINEYEIDNEEDGESSKSKNEKTYKLTGYNPYELPPASGKNKSGKSKRASEIIQDFEARFLNKVRVGKIRNARVLGYFQIKSHVIRLRKANDIPTFTHEAGHLISKIYRLSKVGTISKTGFNTRKVIDELIQLGKATTKSTNKAALREEGIAEFIRIFLTDQPQAFARAPETFEYFKKIVDPDLLGFLNERMQDIWDLVNLNPEDRVMRDVWDKEEVDKERKKAEGLKLKLEQFYTQTVDEYFPVIKDAKILAGPEGEKRIKELVAQNRGYESSAMFSINPKGIKGMYQSDLYGNKVGPSLFDILEPLANNQKKQDYFWKSYAIARRAEDYNERKLQLPNDIETYRQTVRNLESQYPDFPEIFHNVRKYDDNLLLILVQAGFFSNKQAKEIKEQNPNHIHLFRVLDDGFAGIKSSKGNPVKSLRGGGQEILNPYESMVNMTFVMWGAAKRQQLLLEIADMANRAEGKGAVMVKSPYGLKVTEFNLDEVKKQIIDSLIKLEVNLDEYYNGFDIDMEFDTMAKIFRPNFIAKANQLAIYRNGNIELYDVEPELYKALSGMNPVTFNTAMRFIMNIAMKVGDFQAANILYTPRFVVWNTIRETLTSWLQSRTGITIFDIVRGAYSVMSADDWYLETVKRGGTTEMYLANEARFAKDIIKDLSLGRVKSKRLFNKLRHPLNTLRDVIKFTELGTKTAEAKKTVENNMIKRFADSIGKGEFVTKVLKWIDPKIRSQWKEFFTLTNTTTADWDEAIFNMRDLTYDIKRKGKTVKDLQVNRIWRFFNAYIQGLDQAIRVTKDPTRNKRLLIRGALLALFSLFLHSLIEENEWYKKLKPYQKDNFWNIPIGDPKTTKIFLPIPRGFEWAIPFMAVPVRIMDYYKNDNPEAFKGFMSSLQNNFLFEVDPMPLRPFIEQMTNTRWQGIPIESFSDKMVSPKYRYDEYTSTVAKNISKITNKLPFRAEAIQSPKRLDHLIRGFTATTGNVILSAIDELAGKPNYKSSDLLNDLPYLKPIKDVPGVNVVISSFLLNASKSNTISNEYYEGRQKVTEAFNDLKRSGVIDKDTVENVILYKLYNKFDKTINDLKKIQDILEEKQTEKSRNEIRKIDNAILGIKKDMLEISKKIDVQLKK